MPSTVAERKLHTIEMITQLEDETMLGLIEQLLSSEGQAKWVRLLVEAERLDASVKPNTLTDEDIMEEVNAARRARHEAR